MRNPFNRVLEVLATATAADLRRQVQFLRAENQILRSRLKHQVRTTPQERARLIRLGRPLGKAVESLISIVSPRTFMRWVKRSERSPTRRRQRWGRPRSPEATRQLVLRLARETDWGYTRIWGELKKLGITISRTSVMNILKEAGMPRAPQRAETTWDQFLKAHVETLWGCDFVSQRILTKRGFVTAFLMVFLNVKTRQVHISRATLAPSDGWVKQEAESFIAAAEAVGRAPSMVLRDRDFKFGRGFGDALKNKGARAIVLPTSSPNLNAHAERFIQTLRNECLDRFIVLGIEHLDRLTHDFADYYNRQRPHSRVPHCTPAGTGPPEPAATVKPQELGCHVRLGGHVRHYYRKVA